MSNEAEAATISGGANNQNYGNYATVAGGANNSAYADYSFVGGGQGDSVSGTGNNAAIGGGFYNTARGPVATVPGGYENVASGNTSFAAGAYAQAVNDHAFVWSDGSGSTVSTANYQFMARASGGFTFFTSRAQSATFTIQVSGEINPGDWVVFAVTNAVSTIPLAQSTYVVDSGPNNDTLTTIAKNLAAAIAANTSFTSALNITASWTGGTSFTVSCNSPSGWENLFPEAYESTPPPVTCTHNCEPSINTPNSEVLTVETFDITAGAQLAAGSGSWSMFSDRNAKESFQSVNPQTVLAEVATMPVSTWNYKTQAKSIRHIGPMAQDFHAAFGVGENDTTISTVDEGGVALAAIKGLNQKVDAKDAEIQALKQQNASLAERLQQLETLVQALAGQR